jgi:ElaB/YqjD/DUF883 family membrane-anchored ribosome-binding protein
MTNSTTSKTKITDALKVLDEAAKEKKEEIQNIVSDKYNHIKDALFGANAKYSLDSVKEGAAKAAHQAREAGEEKVKEIATQVDQNVHSNPWPYIGGVAVGALLLGYILGRKD